VTPAGRARRARSARRRSASNLYFTNLISARPLMGVAGAGSLAQVVNAALGNRDRFAAMRAFFSGVGEGDAAGIWEDVPKAPPALKVLPKRPAPPIGEMA
jgi:chlorophyllide a reductase subunit Y